MKGLIEFIYENTVVNFGKSESSYGECIILAGGPGSGKSFIKNRINARFKNYDVDELKKSYQKLLNAGKIDDPLRDFDFSKPEDVSDLHMCVKKHGWKNKQMDMIFRNNNSDKGDSKLLPNILFDKVCNGIDDIAEIAIRAKALGYRVTLVWVVSNLETAKINNKIRDRQVGENILVPAHKEVYNTITNLFNNKYPKLNEFIDAAWIGYTAGYGRKLTDKYMASPIIQIKKDDNDKFIFNKKSMVDEFIKVQQPIDYVKVKKLVDSNDPDESKLAKRFIDILNLDLDNEK